MEINDTGFFFIKANAEGEEGKILVLVYVKTDYIERINPKYCEDMQIPANNVIVRVFDKGVDYCGNPISCEDFHLMLTEDIQGDLYDAKHFTPSQMYYQMRKGGLKKMYSERWFEEEYINMENIIKNGINLLSQYN
jgi:hypothetical protein